MHPFVQDRHDPDVAIREMPPINDVVFIPKEEPIDSEFRRDGFRGDTVVLNLVEGGEQASDVFLRLILAPPVPCVAVDVVEAVGGRLLDANGGYECQERFRAITSSAVRG